MNRRTILSAALLGSAAIASAQNVRQEVRVFQSQGAEGASVVTHDVIGGDRLGAFQWIGAGHADGKSIRNAPYSGEVTTETTRILGDGTRIVNRDTASVARDKEGRMRREANLSHMGPFTPQSNQAPRFITITDPVAKEVYVLNPHDRTANKSKLGEPMFYRAQADNGATKHVTEGTFEMKIERRASGGAAGTAGIAVPDTTTFVAPPVGRMMMAAPAVRVAFDSKNFKKEDLGIQNIEGVNARGTRTTHTIPAGDIGNDRDIVSTTETWYSEELQMTIMSKTNDPQFGETVYRINNLRRAEPDPGLFRVPADFKVLENKLDPTIIRRKLKPEGGADQI